MIGERGPIAPPRNFNSLRTIGAKSQDNDPNEQGKRNVI